MRVLTITDTHIGYKKNSQVFHSYFEKFYRDIFFPTIDKYDIKTIIHMGDCFDNRKSIDFKALEWGKRVIFDEAKKRELKIHLLTGNHDVYHRDTNEINSVDLLLKEYDNIETYSGPTEVTLDNLKVLFVPWINSQNEDLTLRMIDKTNASVVFGHLELNGFRVNSSIVMDHGMNPDVFSKFKKVFSGHYHTRSDNGKVYYLGNPYEMFWSDVNDTRGFHIFDTETLKHTPINNPYRMFYNVYYEDTPHEIFNTTEYENKIVKVIVRKKTDTKQYDKFLDKLYKTNVAELKIVENFEIKEAYDFETIESENTLSILNRYVEEAEVSLDKNVIQKLLQEVYNEACELV